MVTLAQRITELREEKGLSRPALAAEVGLPRLSIEKFETGRATPTQEQQKKLANYFGVSLFYLQGKGRDRTTMEDWMDDASPAVELSPHSDFSRPARRAVSSPAPTASTGDGGLFDSLLTSKKFQEVLTQTILTTLRSPEGHEILSQVVRKELGKQR